ncbi:MAG: hypothetical protein K6T80_04950 [Firmicutes bacterium]|nr:hypothetical protein [Bacillota bacterium]
MGNGNTSSRRAISVFVFVAAAVLMIIRVDWWWWGKKIEPLVFGWLSYPMLYQLFIWLAGWGLLAITVKYLWSDE